MPGQQRSMFLLLALATVYSLTLGSLFLIFIPQEHTQALASWSARLSAMADDRRDAIEHWVKAGLEDAGIVASFTTADDLDKVLVEVARSRGYSSATIMDAGRIATTRWGEPFTSDVDCRRLAERVIAERRSAVEFHSYDGQIMVAFASPVSPAPGSAPTDAVLLAEDPGDWLYPFLLDEPTPTMTGETNLVTADSSELVYLAPLKHSDAPPLTLYRSFNEPDSAPAVALRGREGFGEYLDYRDVRVLAATRLVEGTPWGLVVKVDREEAFADSRVRSQRLAMAVLGVLIAAGGLGFGLLREGRLKTERRYRELFEHNPHPMWVHDLETMRFLAVNDAAVSRYGFSREEFLRMTLADLHPAEDMPRLLEHLAREWMDPDHDSIGEWRQLRKDGTSLVVDLHSHMMDFGGRSARLMVAYDITDRVRAETALRESEERYRSFFEEDLTADFITHLDGTIVECNSAFAKIFGCPSVAETKAVNVSALYPDPAVRERLIERVRREKHINYRESEMRRRDGKLVHVVENVVGIFDEAGRLTGLKGYLFDITEHKRLEEELRQSQKMEAVGRLAGGIAHDFSNVLTAIQGFTELLLLGKEEQDPDFRRLHEIQRAAQQGSALTRQLLTFSRRGQVEFKPLDLNMLVRRFESLMRRIIGEDVELILNLTGEDMIVMADPGHLEQVMMNLVINAREAMPLGGQITLETIRMDMDEAMARLHPPLIPGTHVCLSVGDTGSGMDAETQVRIFEPFFTTKEHGTGLGLATVYGIVHESQGHISVYSQFGLGTVMKVWLPVAATDKVIGEVTVPEAPPPGDERVLVVEDERSVRELLVNLLAMLGYKVETAASGEEALELLSAGAGEIDLLITDVILPGIDGREVATRALGLRPGLKVLYTSGYTNGVIEKHGILSKGIVFLQKPFSLLNLARKVREALGN